MIVRSAADLRTGTVPDPTKFLRGDGTWGVPSGGVGGGGNLGQTVVPFAAFSSEGSVAVTGQTGITPTSRVTLALMADTDDVIAQDWAAPFVSNLIAGTGFTVHLRAASGTFKGPVKCNWSWG